MAELVVMAVDQVNPNDPYADAACLKAGDVIDFCPDGQYWSELVQTKPEWRIVKVPDLPEDEARIFLVPPVGKRTENPMLPLRAFRIDFDSLPKKAKDHMKNPRTEPFITVSVSDLLNSKKARPVPDNPWVIG